MKTKTLGKAAIWLCPITMPFMALHTAIDVADKLTRALPGPSPRRRGTRSGAYDAYLHSWRWRELRRQVFARDGWKCAKCGKRHHLEAHHKTYRRLGHENLSDLQTLCSDCHRKIRH